ncbi:MAG: type III polyketide synthase [Planctomycetota bacterium]|nr:MAG: type III polyketide synthase [Planctomycetota bacterium]
MRARSGPYLASLATAFPSHLLAQRDAVPLLQGLFADEDPELVRRLAEHSGVATRHLVLPPADILRLARFGQRNACYQEASVVLAETAARRALERARLAPEQVDVVLDVSCTGIAIPALDVDLAQRLSLRADARRVPITESGCAAGALGLGLAANFAALGQRALVVAVELSSLTLVQGDRSRANLVASLLFGDGAAAAIVLPGGGTPCIAAAGSHLFPDTRTAMGFDVSEDGLRIVLDKELPALLRSHLRPVVERFLARHGRVLADVGLHLVHPGGRRVLEVYRELFGLPDDALRCSEEALRRYGNLSSASILAVLDLALEAHERPAPGRDALVLAFGPGLSAEMLLLRWEQESAP